MDIDGHKLMYHIPRLCQWLKGENVFPIYIEVSLYDRCNHRCIFCAFDFLKHKPNILDKDCLKRFILQSAEKGVESILFSGEGEPLLHEDAADIIAATKKAGIDAALSTNGVMFNEETSKRTLEYLTWVRVSLDAGTPKTYEVIHRSKKRDFKTVIRNLEKAVKIRNNNKYRCTIGAQYLLIPQNYQEVTRAARILSGIGVDYLAIKPYSQHPSSGNRMQFTLGDKELFYLEERLRRYSKGVFQVIVRRNAIRKLKEPRPYKKCLGISFAAHLTAGGDLYPCNLFLGSKEFILGNIYEKTMEEIWRGERRSSIMRLMDDKWDVKKCRLACRLDEINRYLWELKNPSSHINFI